MIWPPSKAWTSKFLIEGQTHFVAISYGGKLDERWVILISVLESSLVVKVSWSQLIDSSNWECGWNEINCPKNFQSINSIEKITDTFTHLSIDSGLTIPITKDFIRPWFRNT